MIRNIPDGWEVKKLGDIGKVFTGSSAPQETKYFENGSYPFVRVSDLSEKKCNNNLENIRDYINGVCLDETKQTFARKGTVLFAKSGMSVKNNHRALLGIDGYIVSHLCAIYIDNEITRNYIYQLLCKIDMVNFSDNEAYPSLKTSTIKSIQLPIPPLPQQEKIVKVLDISSALIEKQKELTQKYDLFLKSKFIEMFGDPISNPMGWEVVKFSKIANVKTTSIKANDISNEVYIALDSIEKETGRLVEAYNSEEADIKSNKYVFTSNMLLYGKLRPYLNKVLLPDFDGICSTDILPVEPIKNLATKEYLAYYLRHSKIVELLSNSVSGANLPRVSSKILKDLNIQKIPIELQKKFASIVEKTKQIKEQESKKLEHLQTLHNSLMDKAFKGEIK